MIAQPLRRRSPSFCVPPTALVAACGWLALTIIATALLRASPHAHPVDLCAFHAVTGLPCPTCGSTRALLAALDGRLLAVGVVAALQFNPLVIITAIVAPIWVTLRLTWGRNVPPTCTVRTQRVQAAGIIALIAANWVWVIWWQGTG